jgi:hypothetical protein
MRKAGRGTQNPVEMNDIIMQQHLKQFCGCFQRVELLVVVVVVRMPSGSQVKIAQPTKKEEKRGAGMQRGCTILPLALRGRLSLPASFT